MSIEIKIPVMVREDGAVFVWEMDTSTDLGGNPHRVYWRRAEGVLRSAHNNGRLWAFNKDGTRAKHAEPTDTAAEIFYLTATVEPPSKPTEVPATVEEIDHD